MLPVTINPCTKNNNPGEGGQLCYGRLPYGNQSKLWSTAPGSSKMTVRRASGIIHSETPALGPGMTFRGYEITFTFANHQKSLLIPADKASQRMVATPCIPHGPCIHHEEKEITPYSPSPPTYSAEITTTITVIVDTQTTPKCLVTQPPTGNTYPTRHSSIYPFLSALLFTPGPTQR